MNTYKSERPMSNMAIEIQNVSKRFRLYYNPVTGPVKELLFFWKRKCYYQEFMAVKDVTITVGKGEIVGIIGPNGAGKTTLLKMIAGLLPVDGGRIKLSGKVTALLALGVGVHPEFSGRENIYYGGMLLGMSKAEVLRKTQEIIEFSELGEFIDRPFRTYSSGMKARLMFATSMSIDPDILIVDEALATGDLYFVEKCSERIREVCKSGATILVVSHNMQQIQRICQRAIFMAEGRIVGEGEPGEMVGAYNKWIFEKEKTKSVIKERRELERIGGTGEVMITEIKLINSRGEETTGFVTGEEMNIELHYKAYNSSIKRIHVFIGILMAKDQSYISETPSHRLIQSGSHHEENKPLDIGSEGKIYIKFDPILLVNNHYSLWAAFYTEDLDIKLCEYRNVRPFFVGKKQAMMSRGGIFRHPAEIWSEQSSK
jgi:lipopolysaccharide transport system ATP-binding protein